MTQSKKSSLTEEQRSQLLERDRADSEKLYAMSLRASWEEGYAEGYAEGYPLGLREGRLLRILASRQLELTPAQRAMLKKADLPTLERWIDLAASITHIDELFSE